MLSSQNLESTIIIIVVANIITIVWVANPKRQLDFGNTSWIFKWGSEEYIQDFYVGFGCEAKVFIMFLDADQGSMGATAPTWMYLAPPLQVDKKSRGQSF